ncbi:MAG: DUF3945 domain-containing protein [Paludibacteraceae bacterium]|jgi:hypothetical protein|nr:DUF3945 domain-containing protein [Paludibacteraceae bacterium]
MKVNNNISVDNQNLEDGSLKKKENLGTQTEYQEKVDNVSDIKKQIEEAKRKQAEELAELERKLKAAETDADKFKRTTVKGAEKDAKKAVKEKQRDESSELARKPMMIMLFQAFTHGYGNKMEQLKAGDQAKNKMLAQLDAVTVKEALSRAINGEETNSLKENESFIFLSHDGDQNNVRIMRTDEEVNQFIKSEELKDIVDRSVNEADKPENERTISYSFITNSDSAALDKKIEEKYGNIEGLSQEGKISLQQEIIKDENSTIQGTVGNTDHFLSAKQLETIQTPDSLESERLLNKELFTEKEVFERLERYGYKKDTISAEDLQKLKEGEKTGLLKISVKTEEAEITSLEAKFRLVRTKDGNTKLMLHPVRKELNLNDQFKGYSLTEQDKKNLQSVGTSGKVVNLTSKDGQQLPCILGVDKDTKELVAINTTRLNIPDKVAGVKLKEEEKNILKKGEPIKRDDLIDKQGIKYTGWIIINPGQKSLDISKKQPPLQIEKDFTPQVKANNDGARTEELKTDKSTTMDRKQTENNDPKEQKTKKKGMKI